MIKNICLLGATGSIGSSVLSLIENNENIKLVAFSFNQNIDKAIEIIEKFKPLLVTTPVVAHIFKLKELYPKLSISSDICETVRLKISNQVVINAIVGSAGLLPTYEALLCDMEVLLANKESLVMAGPLLMDLVKQGKGRIIPVDSEHAGVAQIIDGKNAKEVLRIVLTASGGSLYDYQGPSQDVLVEDALKHPNWQMGAKITIDSATLLNKGFEVIEAHYLFDIPLEQIDVVIHRQSLVHAIVEFNDHSLLYHVGVTDMKQAIWYSLNYPHHLKHQKLSALNIDNLNLQFEKFDDKRFPLVKLAYQACRLGGFYPVILNAANEQAVQLFLKGIITFDKIQKIVTQFLERTQEYTKDLVYNIQNILLIDQLIKQEVMSCFGQ